MDTDTTPRAVLWGKVYSCSMPASTPSRRGLLRDSCMLQTSRCGGYSATQRLGGSRQKVAEPLILWFICSWLPRRCLYSSSSSSRVRTIKNHRLSATLHCSGWETASIPAGFGSWGLTGKAFLPEGCPRTSLCFLSRAPSPFLPDGSDDC